MTIATRTTTTRTWKRNGLRSWQYRHKECSLVFSFIWFIFGSSESSRSACIPAEKYRWQSHSQKPSNSDWKKLLHFVKRKSKHWTILKQWHSQLLCSLVYRLFWFIFGSSESSGSVACQLKNIDYNRMFRSGVTANRRKLLHFVKRKSKHWTILK